MRVILVHRPVIVVEITTQELFDNAQADKSLRQDRQVMEEAIFRLITGHEAGIRKLFEEDMLIEELLGPKIIAQINQSKYIDLVITNHLDEVITINLVQ